MAVGDIIVGLDIGASKVCTIVGQVNKFNEIEIIGHGMAENYNIKKGKILDEQKVAMAIRTSIEAAEEVSGILINSSYVNIKGLNTRIIKKKVNIESENPDDGLSSRDIDNVYSRLQMITTLDKNEKIIDILPVKYNVNGKVYKQDPIGLFCKDFDVEANVIVAKSEYLESLYKTFKLANLTIDGIILETLATSNVILMPEEKELGVLLLDIGYFHTDISAYKENELLFYDTLPVGGNHITNDIALSFDISNDEAEKLKKQYNLTIQALIQNNHEINLNTVSAGDNTNVIKCSDIVAVIEARVREIYQLIRKIIAENNLNSKIECIVITGQGISNLIGAEELAMLVTKINQVRVCVPNLVNIIKPQHLTAFGMVKYVSSLGFGKHVNSNIEIIAEPLIKDKIINFFKKIINKVDKSNEGGKINGRSNRNG